MHKIINKKSIQKITAVIIIMIMCNFIMSGKAFAGYGAASQDPKADSGSASSGQNRGSIKSATNAGISESEIKEKIKSKLQIDDDTTNMVYTNCIDDLSKIVVNYTLVQYSGNKILNDVEVNVTQDDIEAMKDGTYAANIGSVVASGGEASRGEYWNSVSDQEGADGDKVGGLLIDPIASLIQGIGDAVNRILQKMIIGDNSPVHYDRGFFDSPTTITDVVSKYALEPGDEEKFPTEKIVKDYIDGPAGGYTIADIKLTPAEIFAGNVSALDANFFKTETDHDKELGGSEKSIVEQLRGVVSKWYVALRNIAIVGLLSALLYIGIRIVISSSAGDKAKYKQFFVDWVVALCLIFFMHYIMAFTMTMSETVTDVLSGNTTSQGRIQQVIIELTDKTGKNTFAETNGVAIKFKSNFTGLARIKADYDSTSLKMGYTVLYIALTVYTVYFSFVYLKRLLMLAFFTMIAPLVALTYPLDKIKDGKAQAFNYWFKEYMFYALLQPLHMLLYTVFVSSALSVAANNLLYAIVALAFIVPAEKIVKQMFGIKGNTESTLGGFAGGALASQAFNMLKKGPPQPKKGGDAPKGEKGIRLNNPNKPNAMDTLAGDALGSGAENAAQTATAAGIGAAAGAASAQATENEGSEENSNSGAEAQRGTPVEEKDLDQIAAMQEKYGQLEAGQVAQEDNQQEDQNADNKKEDPFATIRAKANSPIGNLGSAINSRVQSAGGWSGIAKGVGKTGAKLAGRAAMMTTMGALGLGVGIVGGDMSDTLKGLGAGLTAGYATGGRLNSAVGNTLTGNNAAGRFLDDAIRGTGPERKRNDYIRSYMSNQENRNRLIEKNPSIKKSELDAQLRQRAELSYDSGVTDAKMLDRAVKLQKQLDEKNPRGVGNAERHGANYDKTVATMQLASKYSDSIIEDEDKKTKKTMSLARELEKNMAEKTNGTIDEKTAKLYKQRARNEAVETMTNIAYLKDK